VFRPRTRGVKCIVECDGKWLMIRNTYGRGHWTFPGGAVRRRERPEHAAIREVAEEVGISLPFVRAIGSFCSTKQYKRDTVQCFTAAVDTADHHIDGKEVLEAAWIAPADIPDFRSGAVDRALRLLEADR